MVPTEPTPPSTTPETGTDPNAPAANPIPVPAEYTFTAPEGRTLDPELVTSATSIFRELGLDNAKAQSLVDWYNATAAKQTSAVDTAIRDTGERWMNQAKADPDLGPRLDAIKANIGSAFNHIRAADPIKGPALVAEFAKAMNETMAGNHPAFIKMFDAMASRFTEGNHISGAGPSPNGQTPNGRIAPASPAARLWPNLPTG